MLYIFQSSLSSLLLIAATGCANNLSRNTNEMQLKISHYQMPCQGESVQLCYVIGNDNGATEYFYDQIEGFEYEWGYNYVIVVENLKNKDSMADGSSFSYRLKKQVSKEKVPFNLNFELPLVVNDYRLVESNGDNCLFFGTLRIDTGNSNCAALSAGQKAVFQHMDGGIRLVEIK